MNIIKIWGFRMAVLLLMGLSLSARNEGCRKKAGTGDDPIVPAHAARPADVLERQLRQEAFAGVRYLNARARLTSESADQTVGADANIIWIRDSVIWLNIRKFGVEAARALITPDSVTVLNRLERTYSTKTWDVLRREYSLPAGFELLQPALLSSAWLAPGLAWHSEVRDSLHRLSGSTDSFTADYRLEDAPFRLRQQTFLDRRESRSLSLGFGGYKKLDGGGWFSYLRRLEAFSPEHGSLRATLELSDVEVNVPKAYRFEIPSHYQRVD
jgi:hypothetical protein